MPMMAEPRQESEKLLLFRSLNSRMTLTSKDMSTYINLEKGFEGEKRFDVMLEEKVPGDFLILPDLLYDDKGSKFQIDTFLISRFRNYLFEIKNSEGDYYYEKGKWYHNSGEEISDPLSQLQRTQRLLSRQLKEHGYNIPLEAFVIFVNPEFNLLQAPRDSPIILPAQLNRFLKSLNIGSYKLNQQQRQLSANMLSWRTHISPYQFLPSYTYDEVGKGLACGRCHTLMTDQTQTPSKILTCHRCDDTEPVTSAVLRTIDEFVLLFPDIKMTTHAVYEWCGGVVSKLTIWKILSTYYKAVGHGKSCYYIKK